MAATLLKVSGLKVAYGGIQAVKGVDLEVREGELVTLIGSNGVAVSLGENVTGDVRITGAAIAQGEGSVGLRVLGDVSGEFMIGSTVAATGFSSAPGFSSVVTTNYVDPDELKAGDLTIAQRRDAEDLLVGGSGLEIRGDLARGFLINGNAVGGVDPTDDVKDVVQDYNENRTTGAISSYGSAPAALIQSLDGAAGDAIAFAVVNGVDVLEFA